MPPFFTPTAFAEDLQHPHLILTTHVLHRGIQTGALLSLSGLGLRQIYSRLSSQRTTAPPARPGTAPSTPLNRALMSAARGGLVGGGLVSLALWGRMRGRSDVEWADRSWRLVHNKGQVEVDGFSYVGLLGGLVAAGFGARRGVVAFSAERMLGGAVLGNLVGVGGYMAWRYGFHGGRFE